MSVKSKAKKVGWWVLKHGWSLGVSWVVDRYVKGAANRAAKEVIGALTGDNPNPSKGTKSLQVELDKLINSKVLPSLQQQQDALRLELDARLERAMGRRRK